MHVYQVIKYDEFFDVLEIDGQWHENGLVQVCGDIWIDIDKTSYYYWTLEEAVDVAIEFNEWKLNSFNNRVMKLSEQFSLMLLENNNETE